MSETTSPATYTASKLMNLIVTLLTPMFFAAAEGNLTFARQAAIETINAYRAETQSDLITVAKVIAFGLAALAAISLSLAEDLPIAIFLRLNASANASDRSEHRNRLVLNRRQPAQLRPAQRQPAQPEPTSPEPPIDEAALVAAAQEMKQRTADNLARVTRTAASEPTTPTASDKERRHQAAWAASAAAIAAETAASLSDLSPEERYSAAMWIDVLNDCAKDFMEGDVARRPRQGDLASIMPAGT